MKGLLQHKSAGSQFILLLCITAVSFFIIGIAGMLVVSMVTGRSLAEIADVAKMDLSVTANLNLARALQVVQFIALFLAPSIICARLFSTDGKRFLGLRKPHHAAYFLAGIAVMILALPLTNLIGELNKSVQFPKAMEEWMRNAEDEATNTMRSLLSRRTIMDLILNIFLIAGLAALGEELLFRGLVQRILIKMFRNAWTGIIVTAILFSAMHMQFYGFLPRFMLGILLGVIYWYSGSLWVPIVAHFFYDGFLIVLAYFNPEMLNDETTVPMSNYVVGGIVGLVIIIFIFIWMRRSSRTTYELVYKDDSVKDHPF